MLRTEYLYARSGRANLNDRAYTSTDSILPVRANYKGVVMSMRKRAAFIRVFTVTVIVLTQLFCVTLAAAADIIVTYNGKALRLSSAPVVTDGRVMVPFRGIAESLGADVDWNLAAKKITMTKGTSKVEVTVGSKTATINGTATQLDVAPYVKNNATLVPVRFISEALGVDVNWTGSVVELRDQQSKAVAETTGSFSVQDLSITIEGDNWGLMQDAGSLVKVLGKSGKVSYIESISCGYEGMDRLYSNENAQISALPINGKGTEIIDEIILTSDQYTTTKGIKVGSKKNEVIAAYGKDFTTTGNIMTYWAGEVNGLKTPRIYFEMSGDSVKEIGIFGGRNAG